MSRETTRQNILDLIDSFVEQVNKIRRILLGVSISAVILAPLAIGLSIYLITHPSFFEMLESENEFGTALCVLLGAVIIISSVWLVTGIRQYRPVKFLSEKYKQYMEEKDEIDKKIASQYGLDQD
ncbi:MAG: hypothetical protein ACT4N5_00625 [Nitrosopumilaceae archaeon]